MPSWKKVIVSGSDASLNSINVATNVVAQSFTGSLFGTASFAVSSSHAIFADTASQATSASYASFALSSSRATTSSYAFYAETASYAVNITVSGSISDVDYINFDTSASFVNVPGRLGWDSGENTLQLGLAGGNVTYSVGEQIWQYCYNAETSSLSKGQVVYISGSQGNKIAVKLASDVGDPTSAGTLGFVGETITAGGNGWVITEGNLRNLNTIGLTPGALLFLGSTPGTYTQTPPVAPRHAVRLGYVERVHASVGSIYVKIDNGYEIGELHDVVDSTTTASYGDLFVKSGSVWHNSKQLTGSYGLTGSLQATSFTGSLLGTASYADQALSSSFATTASYVLKAVSASYSDQALSSSYALTASYAEIFPYTGSAKITGSLDVTGSIESTTVRSNIFINNQNINSPIFVPSGSNALIVGPVNLGDEVVVEDGGNLYVTDFTNPTPNLQAVTDVGSTTTNSITAANFITTSDRRLKSDIKKIENPFEILGGIKSYEYIKDGKKDAGFIAQEVQETIPYAVFENEEGMLTMSDRPLLAYLYAAVMELKEENKQLRERLGAINNKL